jgi:hypothetical protein
VLFESPAMGTRIKKSWSLQLYNEHKK